MIAPKCKHETITITKGLCKTCYHRWWRRTHRELANKIARKSIRKLKLDAIKAYGYCPHKEPEKSIKLNYVFD